MDRAASRIRNAFGPGRIARCAISLASGEQSSTTPGGLAPPKYLCKAEEPSRELHGVGSQQRNPLWSTKPAMVSPPLFGRQSCSHNGQFRWYRGRTWWPSTVVPADLEFTAAAASRQTATIESFGGSGLSPANDGDVIVVVNVDETTITKAASNPNHPSIVRSVVDEAVMKTDFMTPENKEVPEFEFGPDGSVALSRHVSPHLLSACCLCVRSQFFSHKGSCRLLFRRHHRYLCTKTGARLSMKALMPSVWSSVANAA
jgi:hypothetical protein